jgi:AcrR family transcriptional regulator
LRRLAADLGVGAMSLYRYVPGKAELLDLMLDEVYLRMPREDWTAGGWRERLTTVAEDNRALYAAHPWAVALARARPPLGPGQLAKYEHELRALEGTGLDDVAMDAALTLVLGFVRANALEAVESEAIRRASGLDDTAWWEANAPLLAELVDPEEYPTAVRVGEAAGAAQDAAFDPEFAYAFGLARVLDGIGVLIAARGR